MKKKKKGPKIDGLSADDIARIRTAIRKVWSWSHPRRLCEKRCVGTDGFSYCELCGERSPKVYIDHIETVGNVDGGFIDRLFVPSSGLQGLCKDCHSKKTKEDNAKTKAKRIGLEGRRKGTILDFF